MQRLLIVLAALIALTWGAEQMLLPSDQSGAIETLVLGFVILAAHALGLLLAPLGLPMVSAHLLLGLGAGPQVSGLITTESIESLKLIDTIALALIALTAGGELVVGQIKPLLKSILSITLTQVVLISVSVGLIFWGLVALGGVPFAEGLGGHEVLAICMLVGVLAVAKSPATTIAIITETRAQGRFTDTVLGVTVLKDVVVILMFALVMSAAQTLTHGGAQSAGADVSGLGSIAVSLGMSIAVGLAVGFALAPLLPRAGRQRPILIGGLALVVAAVAQPLHLDPLIMCIATGFTIRNFTQRGRELIRGIESISPMVYAVFFTMAGADLDLRALASMWVIATALVVARAAATFGSTWLGSRMVEDQPAIRRVGWMGFMAQAGVTLGLASLVAQHFPTWGGDFKTLVVGVIAINQLAGPILFKFAIMKSGDAGKAASDSAKTH